MPEKYTWLSGSCPSSLHLLYVLKKWFDQFNFRYSKQNRDPRSAPVHKTVEVLVSLFLESSSARIARSRRGQRKEWAEKTSSRFGVGRKEEEILLLLSLSLLVFRPFPLRFVKLRYEKLFLSCNGRKTLVNSKYQLKRANLHLVFIGFQSNYSFFNVCNLEKKTGFRKEMKKMRDVGFSWQRSGRPSRPW